MSAALQASAGYSLPIASVKAGLSSDYDQSNSYALHLVTGMFDSPVLLMYYGKAQGMSPSQSKLFADLLFWKWYKDHPERIQTENWILKSLGVLRFTKPEVSSKTQNLSSTPKETLHQPRPQPMAFADAKFQNQTQISVNSFQTAALFDSVGALHRIFFPLPTISKLVNDIPLEATTTVDVASSTLTLVDRTPRSTFKTSRVYRLNSVIGIDGRCKVRRFQSSPLSRT